MLRFLVPVDGAQSAAARLLAERISVHHPEAELDWLVCDPRPLSDPATSGDQTVHFAVDHQVAGHRFVDLVMATSIEFARWAAIPAVVGRLLDGEPGQTIVVVSPTVDLHGPLDDLVTRSAGGALLLPRRYDQASRVSEGGWIPEFAVIGPLARPVVEWWNERASTLLRSAQDISEDVRLDPWAAFFDSGQGIVVAGDARYRVSPWTVAELRLDVNRTRGEIVVDGRPVVLAHFPGFDPREPWWYAPPSEDPIVFASESEPVRILGEHRATDLLRAGWTAAEGTDRSPLLGWTPGAAAAAAFRDALLDGDEPPNPYVSGEVADYLGWVTAAPSTSETGISIAADDVWNRRDDLASVMPSVKWSDQPRFSRWLWTHGLTEGDANLALLPDPPRPARASDSRVPPTLGVNLVGYHGSDAGLGVAVRRVALALDAAGVPWQEVRYDRTASRQRGGSAGPALAPYYFHLVLIAPDQLPLLIDDLPGDFFSDRYTIGLWYWETDVLTPSQVGAVDRVDELWGATSYLANVYRKYTAKPVRQIPIPLVFPEGPSRTEARRSLGFDDRFTFLFSFDFLSIPERKNPTGVIDAFQRAFPDDAGVRLIIKSINGDRFARERERIAHSFAGDPRIEMWDRYLSASDRLALVAAADCYVSLHRSEGLGLTMAEAMAAGTPVIATRYSGNLDFMDDGCALLIDAEEVEIGPGHHYPPTGHWADPDLEQAAEAMVALRSDPELGPALAAAALGRLAAFDAEAIGRIMSKRLVELWRVASVSGSLPAPSHS